MNTQYNNQNVTLNWTDIPNLSEQTITARINEKPRYQIDRLIRQIAEHRFSQRITYNHINKLFYATKTIPLPSTLVRRLYFHLTNIGKITETEKTQYIQQHDKTHITLDAVFTNHLDTVKEIEQLKATPPALRTTQLIDNLRSLESLSNEQTTDLKFLVRQGEIRYFPINSVNGTSLFRFLCKQVNPKDKTLYPAIAELIRRSITTTGFLGPENVNIHDQYQGQTGLDYFLDNGGYLPELLRNVNFGNTEDWETQYFGYEDKEISELNLADRLIGLNFPNVRTLWLNNSPHVDFLEGKTLKAAAQFMDYTTPKGVNQRMRANSNLSFWVPHIKKMGLLKQKQLLSHLEVFPETKNILKGVYSQSSNIERTLAANKMHIVMAYLHYNKSLENGFEIPQLEALEKVRYLNPDNRFKPFNNTNLPYQNPRKLDIIQDITTLINLLETIDLWSQQPAFGHARDTLAALIKKIGVDAPALINENLDKLNKCLTEGPVVALQYDILYQKLKCLALGEHIQIFENIDFDEYVSAFFKDMKNHVPAQPSKEQIESYLSTIITPGMNLQDVKRKFEELNLPTAVQNPSSSSDRKRVNSNNDDDSELLTHQIQSINPSNSNNPNSFDEEKPNGSNITQHPQSKYLKLEPNEKA